MHRNQKGFLIALCLCMLSVSGIYGVYQYQKPDTKAPSEEDTSEQEREAANSSGTIAKADTKDRTEEAKIETEEDIYKIGEAELARAETEVPKEETQENHTEEETPETEAESDKEIPQEAPASEQKGSYAFAEGSSLLWPVKGDVLLNYSMDKSIYFSTLNQYKYHPAIVISAETGSEVWCAADGKVKDIKVDEETGTTVSMDLGGGYEAVYGQLKEMAVQEGDVVKAGALLGYVSEPTKYYTLEGSNLYFQLLKDGEPVNPMDYME